MNSELNKPSHTADPVGQALDQTQAIALRTAALVDGFEERLAKLMRRVEVLEQQNIRLHRALSPYDTP